MYYIKHLSIITLLLRYICASNLKFIPIVRARRELLIKYAVAWTIINELIIQSNDVYFWFTLSSIINFAFVNCCVGRTKPDFKCSEKNIQLKNVKQIYF